MNVFIGIDNGVSGSVAVINDGRCEVWKTPTIEQLNYTKVKKNIHRLNVVEMKMILLNAIGCGTVKCLIERPFVNPMMFQSSLSAIRCLEATLIIIEDLQIPYEYIDSKEWQSALLPKGIWKKTDKGRMKADPKELKRASLDIGRRLFPQAVKGWMKDADSLLIAEYCRRKEQGGNLI